MCIHSRAILYTFEAILYTFKQLSIHIGEFFKTDVYTHRMCIHGGVMCIHICRHDVDLCITVGQLLQSRLYTHRLCIHSGAMCIHICIHIVYVCITVGQLLQGRCVYTSNEYTQWSDVYTHLYTHRRRVYNSWATSSKQMCIHIK
jgi:hypothetical protein